MKKAIAILLAVLMLLGMVACSSTAKPQQTDTEPAKVETETPEVNESLTQIAEATTEEIESGAYEEDVRIASEEDLPTADPYAAASSCPAYFTNLTFDTLIYLDVATSEVIPELASSWDDVNGDGTVWDIHLVENAKFHDGSDFTADDVIFTWNYVTDASKVVNVVSGAFVTNTQSVEAVDPYTVRFTLSQPTPDFISNLEIKIYSKTAFANMSAEEAAVIGTGPYYFNQEMTTSGIQFVATRNDAYWGGTEKYPTKNLIFVWMPNMDTAVAALQAGEVDVLFNVGASQAATIESDSNCLLQYTSGTGSWYIGFNFNYRPIFSDLNLRKAITMAVDKQSIVDVAFEGWASISKSFVSPIGIGYSDSCTGLEYDTDAAKELLAQTAYNGETFVIAYPTATAGLVAQVIQASLSQIGINSELVAVDTNNWTAYKAGDQYDMFVDAAAYQGALLFNPTRFFYTGGSRNFYGYYSEQMESLIDGIAAKTSWDEMLEEFKVLQQYINDDIPVAPLVYDTMIYATRSDVQGLLLRGYKNSCDFSTLYIKARS